MAFRDATISSSPMCIGIIKKNLCSREMTMLVGLYLLWKKADSSMKSGRRKAKRDSEILSFAPLVSCFREKRWSRLPFTFYSMYGI